MSPTTVFSIAYEQRGRKDGASERPFLLLHGLLFSSKHNHYLADVLAEHGNRVIMMDFLGHGESDQPDHSRHYNLELFARPATGPIAPHPNDERRWIYRPS